MTQLSSLARPPRGRSCGLTYHQFLHRLYDQADRAILPTLREWDDDGWIERAWAIGESVDVVLDACAECATKLDALAGQVIPENPGQSAAA